MITSFNALREFLGDGPRDVTPREGNLRTEYVKAMCLIQIAQELNEIKNIMLERK